MDFFQRQDLARKRTRYLVVYFILALLLIIAGIYALGAFLFLRGAPSLWHPQLLAGVTVVTLLVVLIGSLGKTLALRSGGGAVARMLGGRPLNPVSSDLNEQKLLNVVEEMAIASGTSVPEIYILDHEKGINAFAAGWSSGDAAIGVTRGCMESLSRDELQGVIAHEFSHILNGDMRLNIRLIGIIHGILAIAIIGRVLLYSGMRSRHYALSARGGRSQGANPLPLLGVGLMIIGSIGVFFGRLIKSAISRQREYLADASAVQFTRNPSGLAGALKKIGGLIYGSKLENSHAEEASHLFFGNGLKESWFNWMSTHPPLVERIRLVDPQFDGTFSRLAAPEERPLEAPQRPAPTERRGPFPPILRHFGEQSALPPVIAAGHLLETVGAPTPQHLEYAAQLRAGIPAQLKDAAHESFPARALVYCLVLYSDPHASETAWDTVERIVPAADLAEMRRLAPSVRDLESSSRLPLADLTLPALRGLSREQFLEFSAALPRLIALDGQVDLFEFALQKVLMRHLEPHFQTRKPPVLQYYALRGLTSELTLLLSALAHTGHRTSDQAEAAFQAGLASFQIDGDLAPLSGCGLEAIDQALEKLSLAVPTLKKRVLQACIETVSWDGVIQAQQAELLRAIADTLDCPLPPFLTAKPQILTPAEPS